MLCLLPVLLVASGFLSGSETALFFLNRHQRFELSRAGSVAGKIVTQLLSETRTLLITLLLGNMVINVLYFVITTVLILRMKRHTEHGAVAVTVASIAVLVTLILCGEVMPKLLAARAAVRWSKLAAIPLMLVHRAVTPVRSLLNMLVITPLARLIAPQSATPELSAKELETLLQISQSRGVIDHGEEQLLQQVLELGQLTVRDLMTPRVDIEAFDIADDPSDLIELIRRTRLSWIPVYRDDLDHVTGIVRARHVLLHRPDSTGELAKLVQPVQFVPEQQHGDQLLLTFRRTGATFAIVVDEYGGTSGLITLEDAVEHMVGHIAGPYESQRGPMVESVGVGQWRVSAELPIHEWNDVFGQVRPSGGVSTIGGLVMAKLGRLPVEGDVTKVGNVDIRVASMHGPRMLSLELRVDTTADEGEST